jgi:hypothetical protein
LQAIVTSVGKDRLEAFFGKEGADCILRHIERGDDLEAIFGSVTWVILDIAMGQNKIHEAVRKKALAGLV